MLRATLSTSARTCFMASDCPAMRLSATLGGAAGGVAGGGVTGGDERTEAGASRVAATAGPARIAVSSAASAPGCSERSVGKLDGSVLGAVEGPRPRADATTARNCFKSTGLVR